MGFDIYCCICGNSCKGADFNYLKGLFNAYKVNISDKELKKIESNLKWINNKITLYANNQNKLCKNNNCHVENHLPFRDPSSDEYGILLHYDCWKFIKIIYNIELQYKNLPVNYKDENNKYIQDNTQPLLMNVNYGDIKKYWGQDMDFYNMYLDNNLYMLQSPLYTGKNVTRIKKIIKQIKLKKELRPSPSISATFYKNNIIKIGNNNKFWIIKNNKWNEIKEDVIKKIFNIKPLSSWNFHYLSQIGEFSTIPLFINNLKNNKLELIGTTNAIKLFENSPKNNKFFL